MRAVQRFLTVAALAWVMTPALARADEATASEPTPARARLVLAESTLRAESASAHRGRVLGGVLGIGLGGATAGVATVLLAREVTPGAAILAVQGGVVVVGGVYGLLRPDPFEELDTMLSRSEARGLPSAATVEALEQRWYELAVSERRSRLVQGTASSVFGGGLLMAGAIVAASPREMDPTTRGLYTRTLVGSGIALFGAGLAKLLVPSGVERGYSAFTGTARGPSYRVAALPGTGLTFVARF